MVVKIKDVIKTPNAILQKFGLQIYEVVKKLIDDDQKVELSFEGLTNLTSSFCNASIGKLYTKYGVSLNAQFSVINVDNEYWIERVEEAKILALYPEKAKELDDLVSSLFD